MYAAEASVDERLRRVLCTEDVEDERRQHEESRKQNRPDNRATQGLILDIVRQRIRADDTEGGRAPVHFRFKDADRRAYSCEGAKQRSGWQVDIP